MKRGQWYGSLAGTLALVVAAAIALGLQLGGDSGRARPGTKATATACHDNLPQQWQQALRAAVVALAQPAEPLAVAADGTLYARTADGSILAIDKHRSIRTVYHLAAGTSTGQAVRLYPAGGKVVVVTLDTTGHRVSRIDVVDVGSGRAQRVAVTGASDGAAVQDGALYWDERPDPGSPGGLVRRYDLVTGKTTTVDFGQVSAPAATATGVSWGSGSAPASLPAKLRSALPPGAAISTDGTAYAWASGGALYWAGGAGTVRGPMPAAMVPAPQVQAVAGSFVLFGAHADSAELYLLDARSGTVADLGLPATGIALGGGGVLALGGPLGGATGTPPLLQVVTAGLPALGC